MIDIIRAIRKMPLNHFDINTQRWVVSESRKYVWDSPYLFKLGNDGVMRRCVPREERQEILRKCTGRSTVETIAIFGPKPNCGPVDTVFGKNRSSKGQEKQLMKNRA
jgi:hypothetical protein